MTDWFQHVAAGNTLSEAASAELQERGYVVLTEAVPPSPLRTLSDAYDAAVESATGPDIKIGSTSTRVTDFVNRGAEYDDVYTFAPLLEAAAIVVGGPFKLSSFHARTLKSGAPDQGLHVDVPRHTPDWPLLGFILMVDEFLPDNGATRFVPGSHRLADIPPDTIVPDADQVPACGAAGSLLVFNGSPHGHGTNSSNRPRRSLQGAFIPREGRAGTDFGSRMRPETRARLSPLALYLLALAGVQ